MTAKGAPIVMFLLIGFGAGPLLAAQERQPQGPPPERGAAVRGGEAGPRGGGEPTHSGAPPAATAGSPGPAGAATPGGGTMPGLGGGAIRRPGDAGAMPSRARGGDFSQVTRRAEEGGRFAVPRGEPVGASRGATLEAAAGAAFAEAAPPLREVPQFSRPRGDRPPVGHAVPRETAPRDERRVVYPLYYTPDYWYWYPYGVGYPWYGAFGLGFLYYDPWWWDAPGYYPVGPYARPYGAATAYAADVGQLRLKVKPRHAEVYVDGYFVGTVDQFDGVFQRLRLRTGAHRVEIRADGYEPVVFDVLIPPYETITYTGELRRRVP
jgi:hypothetical protein